MKSRKPDKGKYRRQEEVGKEVKNMQENKEGGRKEIKRKFPKERRQARF